MFSHASQRCVDVAGGKAAPGAALVIWDCSGSDSQRWTFPSDGTMRALGLCAEVAGGSTADGAELRMASCDGGPRVLWRIGRDLLQQGMTSTSGLGHLRMWPSNRKERATAWLQLTSHDTAALFELPVPPLATWLEYTYKLVPVGSELTDIDWDIAATALLGDPGARAD